jgi:hypothetical protein
MRSLEMRKARERIVLYEVFFFGILRMSVCVLVCVFVRVCVLVRVCVSVCVFVMYIKMFKALPLQISKMRRKYKF